MRHQWTDREDAWLNEHYLELGPQGCFEAGYLGRTYLAIKHRAERLGLKCGRWWTDEEITWLKKHYAKLGPMGCSKHLNRTCRATGKFASLLGLKCEGWWTDGEVAWLKENYATLGLVGCVEAGCLDRTRSAIWTQAQKLGLTAEMGSDECSYRFSEARKRAWANGRFDGAWTLEEDDYLRENYSELGPVVCSEYTNRTYSAMLHRAMQLGLTEEARRWAADEDTWLREYYDELGAKGCFETGFLDRTHLAIQGRARRLGLAPQQGSTESNRLISEAQKKNWANGIYDSVFQSPTSIELQVAAALDIMGIEHQPQYRPDGYSCVYDEFVPPATLIEIHGDYWHGDQQPENQKRDAEKAQWAADNGFDLVTIWEHELKEQGAWSLTIERVLPLVK